MKKERAVVVSTSQKFCVFGYMVATDNPALVKLVRSRLIIYWDTETSGLWGLAAEGPGSGSRLSGRCTATFADVVFILDCEPEAVAVMEAHPVYKP